MKELCSYEAVLIVSLRAAIKMEMLLTYCGMVIYDPRDFSYWGA